MKSSKILLKQTNWTMIYEYVYVHDLISEIKEMIFQSG